MEEDLGSRIIRRRKYLGYSQEQLATAAGVSRQTVGRWENNVVTPKPENIAALCRILATDKDYFLSENSVRDNAGHDSEQPPSSLVSAQSSMSEPCAKRPSNKVFVIIAVTLTVLLVPFACVIALVGRLLLVVNEGDKVNCTINLDKSIFVILLVILIIIAVIDLLLIALIMKRRKMQTKCKHNVNL